MQPLRIKHDFGPCWSDEMHPNVSHSLHAFVELCCLSFPMRNKLGADSESVSSRVLACLISFSMNAYGSLRAPLLALINSANHALTMGMGEPCGVDGIELRRAVRV